MRVVAASRRSSPELEALDVVHVPVDLMTPDAPAEVIARALKTYGRLDVVVNNAGGPVPGSPLPPTPASSPATTRTGTASSSSTCTRRSESAGPRCRCSWRPAAA